MRSIDFMRSEVLFHSEGPRRHMNVLWLFNVVHFP